MHETGLSRSQARRIVRKASVLYGIESTASRRSHAVTDTIELLLTGSSRAVCRELLMRDGAFTPKQVRLILHKAVADVNKQELHEELLSRNHAANRMRTTAGTKNISDKRLHFLDLVCC